MNSASFSPSAPASAPVPVYLAQCSSYENPELVSAIESVLLPQIQSVGGVSGKSILLKPNMLSWRKKDDPACVHPRMIVETARFFLKSGASRVAVMENPAVLPAPAILKMMGIADELKSMGVETANFSRYRQLENLPETVIYRNLEIASEFGDFDYTVDLAKAKTHAMMTLTLCVKNLFGFVNGNDRIAWHLAVGRNYDQFADMLLDLYQIIHPQFNLLDGIVCMEGNGPGNGTPTERHFIAGAVSSLALDRAISPLLGCASLPILERAEKRNLLPEAILCGDTPDIAPLTLPDEPSMELSKLHLGVGIPSFAQKLMHEHLLARPVVEVNQCVGCGVCVKMCPPKTLKLKDGKPCFDLPGCIRCFCCQEYCPQGAIYPRKTLLMKFFRSMESIFRG